MIWRLSFLLRRFVARRKVLLAGWAAGLAALAIFVLPLKTFWPNDYYGFWIVGQAAPTLYNKSVYGVAGWAATADHGRAGAETAPTRFEREMRKFYRMMSSTASPMHYAVFKLLSSGNLRVDYDRYRWLSASLYAIAILAFATYLRFPAWSLPFLVWVFTVPFWPFRRDVMDSNNSAALAGASMAAILFLASPRAWARFAAGFLLGLIVLFKPIVLYAPFLALVALATADRRGLAPYVGGLACAAVAGFLIPWFVFGPVCTWTDWMKHATSSAFKARYVTGGLLGRYFRVDSPVPFQILGVGSILLLSALVWNALRGSGHRIGLESPFRPRGFEIVGSASAGLALYCVAGIMVWGHYFTLAVPAALISLRPRGREPRDWAVFILGAVSAALLGFHQYLRNHGWTSWGNYSPYTILGTTLVIGITLWDVSASHRRWLLARATEPAAPL